MEEVQENEENRGKHVRDVHLSGKWDEPFLLHRAKICLVSCLIINLAFFILLIAYGDPTFATNDDFRMRLIVSGRYGGAPDSQAMFMNIVLSSFLAWLYSLNSQIEWYGFFFEGAMFVSVVVIEYLFLKTSETVKAFLARWIVLLLLSALVFQKQILMPQFTVVAAFFAGAAISLSVFAAQSWRESGQISLACLVPMTLFISLSFAVRLRIALMALPVLLIVLVYALMGRHDDKKLIRFIVLSTAVPLLCISVLYAAQQSRLLDDDFATYFEYNDARSGVFDYRGFPDYEKNKAFYDSLGFSAGEFKALSNRNYDIGEAGSTQDLVLIQEYSEEIDTRSIASRVGNAAGMLFKQMSSIEVRFTLAGFFIAFLLFAITARKSSTRLIPIVFLAYMLVAMFAMCVSGRLMGRVVEVYCILGTSLCLSGFSRFSRGTMFDRELKRTELCVGCLSFALLAVLVLLANQYSIQGGSSGGVRPSVISKSQSLQLLREYAHDRPSGFFFYNANDFIGASESLFNHGTQQENLDSLGSWYAKSPLYYKRNEMYGFDTAIEGLINNENVYYAELGGGHASIDVLLKERGYSLVQCDSIKAKSNQIKLYRCERNP